MDYLVIGAGPAGLQLGLFLKEAGHGYQILEAGTAPGQFFRTYPRHRQLISINKRHTGETNPEVRLRMDWNSLLTGDAQLLFPRYSSAYFPHADDLVRYLADVAEDAALNIRYDCRATTVTREDDGFVVVDQRGQEHRARRLVVATGVSLPNIPAFPGVQLTERYESVSVDPVDFTDQRVLVIGKGNSALETADNLVATAAVIHVAGPKSMRMAWRTHFVGDLRAVNNNFLDTYQLKSQNAILDGEVLSIDQQDDTYRVRFKFTRANEAIKELSYDRVIVCTGFRFDASIFDAGCRPQLARNDRLPALTAAYESTNVPDLYFAGTLMQERDYKKSTGGFIHGFRYAVRALSRILDQRHHAREWPHRQVDPTPSALAEAVISRVNVSSALWQQFGVIGDLLVVEADGPARYYDEVPVDYVRDGGFTEDGDCVTITLEYGPDHDKVDPFDITSGRTAQNSPEQAHDASYLHPVLRHYSRGELVSTHHLAENLENEWDRPDAHRAPLERFLAEHLHLSVTVGG
jgi:thioredoxin reductase